MWPLLLSQVHATPFAKAVVVSDCAIASQVGADIMRQGGNAVDAAVATGLALAVTFPAAGNLGGGGFLVMWKPKSGQMLPHGRAVDFREVAPAAATANMYLDAQGAVTDESRIGHKAAGVPGTVRGLYEAHQHHGKLKWAQVVEPARKLAANGFPLGQGLANSIAGQRPLFNRFPASKAVFSKANGERYEWKETWRQPDLAKTLERIRDEGAKGFYEGKTAELIAADMKANGGLITAADLKNYKVVWREPMTGKYRDQIIVTMPPPSSGGVCLLQMLGMLEPYEISKTGFGSSATLHPMVEAMKRAFADRSTNLGDPAFVPDRTKALLDPAYIAKRRAEINPDKATPAKDILPFEAPAKEGENTTHFSVVDPEGGAVSVTYTLNTGYGSGAVVKGAGFLLNNEMDDFAAKPGTPNVFGLIQGPQNAIQPGKRPLSSMTPTIVLNKDSSLSMVLGSPGGPTIINTVLQTLLNIVDHRMNVQQAVATPRFHHQWAPDQIRWEPYGLPADLKSAMEAKGHVFATRGERMGSCHAVAIGMDGVRQAGVDPRIQGSGAAGF